MGGFASTPAPDPHPDQAQWLAAADQHNSLQQVRALLESLDADTTKHEWTMQSELIVQAIEDFGLPSAVHEAESSDFATVALDAYIEQLGWTFVVDYDEDSLPPNRVGVLKRVQS